ncbi:MAG: TerD family protein [Bacilli bacterium]|nr:TerD family protein [Bacilli bacterium]
MARKFVKAVCSVKNRHYGLDVDEYGGKYEVTNIIDITAEQAKLLPTQVRQDKFYSHSNLLPCSGDGSRLIGGSSYPMGKGGCNNGKFNAQCMYCKNFRIDYASSHVGGQYKKGDVVHLSQGQDIVIGEDEGALLEHLVIGAGWDISTRGSNMDVDSAIYLFSGDDIDQVIYFGNKESKDSAVRLHADNLTGDDSDTEGQDDEIIDIFLNKLDQRIDRLYIVFNIYQAKDRHQNLSSIRNMYFRVADPKSMSTLIDYKIGQTRSSDSGVIVASITRVDGGWSFKAMGKTLTVNYITELNQSSFR